VKLAGEKDEEFKRQKLDLKIKSIAGGMLRSRLPKMMMKILMSTKPFCDLFI